VLEPPSWGGQFGTGTPVAHNPRPATLTTHHGVLFSQGSSNLSGTHFVISHVCPGNQGRCQGHPRHFHTRVRTGEAMHQHELARACP
jgi:hypothetical protein